MNKLFKIILLISISTYLYAGQYAVVVNQKNKLDKISHKHIKDIFLKKRHFIDDQKMIALNVSASMPIRMAFEKKVLKMDRERLNIFWTKQHFQGISPPLTQSSIKSAKAFIKNVDGAIGYLPKKEIDETLKVLYEF
jgi:ABC-type phosphate transport system substrate-binding protein